jgi:hypothetical protein
MSEVSTVTEGGMTVTSNNETPEQIKSAIAPIPDKEPDPDLSEAASKLGKEGAAASAAKRTEAKATGAEDEAGEASEEAVDASGKPLGKPRHDPRARMLEATREAAEVKRERDAIRAEKDRLAAELAQLRAGKPAEEPKKAVQATGDSDPEPDENDFPTYAEYTKALARYTYRQEQKATQQQESQRRQAEEHRRTVEARVGTFMERVAGVPKDSPELVAKFQAFTETLSPEVRDLQSSEQRKKFWMEESRGDYQRYVQLTQQYPLEAKHIMTDEIIGSERAPDLMRYLTAHPAELQRLAALRTTRDIEREVARLEVKLERQDAAPTATASPAQSIARPPLRPVSGTPHTATSVPGEDASYEDHKRFWLRKDKERTAQR